MFNKIRESQMNASTQSLFEFTLHVRTGCPIFLYPFYMYILALHGIKIYIFFFWGGLDAYEYYDGDNETEYEVNIIIIILMIIIMIIVVLIIENTSVLRLLKSGTRSHFWYINNR